MKTEDFSEINAAFDLKIGILSSGMSIECQGHLHMKIKTGFSQKLLGYLNQIFHVSYQVHGNENLLI